MGYYFTVNVNGKITALWDFSGSGLKTLKLWSNTGTMLNSVNVYGWNTWVQGVFSTPTEVTAGTYYRVSTSPNGGSYYAVLPSVPVTYGDITILSGVFDNANGFPLWDSGLQIYGIPDITFIPD